MSESAHITSTERRVLDLLDDAWNAWLELDGRLDCDTAEVNRAINAAQNIVGCRVATRADPDVWRSPDYRSTGHGSGATVTAEDRALFATSIARKTAAEATAGAAMPADAPRCACAMPVAAGPGPITISNGDGRITITASDRQTFVATQLDVVDGELHRALAKSHSDLGKKARALNDEVRMLVEQRDDLASRLVQSQEDHQRAIWEAGGLRVSLNAALEELEALRLFRAGVAAKLGDLQHATGTAPTPGIA